MQGVAARAVEREAGDCRTPAWKRGFCGLEQEVGGGEDVRLDGSDRRMSKDYESLTLTSETLMCVTMIRLMLKRLTRGAG